jgi:hypothetical protein
MFRMLKILPLLVLAGFAIFATGCGTDHAKVRVVNASPDALNQDVAVDGKTVVTDLDFGGLSPATGYLTVAAGNRRVEFRDTGTTTDVINSTVGFASQKEYTLFAQGKVGDDSIAALLKTDDNSAPPSGNIKLRVIHDAPDGPAHVDVYVVAPLTDITDVAPTISSLAYQQASDYQTAAAATYEIIVTDSTDLSKTRIIDHPFDLAAGEIRTLVTLNVQNANTMSDTLLVLNDLN